MCIYIYIALESRGRHEGNHPEYLTIFNYGIMWIPLYNKYIIHSIAIPAHGTGGI